MEKTYQDLRQSFLMEGAKPVKEPLNKNAARWFWGRETMIEKILYAAVRAALMAIVVLIPTAVLPVADQSRLILVAALVMIAFAFTFIEYSSRSPNLIEFRDAPPFNRVRFVSFATSVLVLSLMAEPQLAQSNVTRLIGAIGLRLSDLLDFPYSPVRLMVLMLPEGAANLHADCVRIAAGNAYLISLLTLSYFVLHLRRSDWPNAGSSFNFYVNLPNFDPTSGDDVVARLQRSAQINLILGFLLPFLIPAVVKWTNSTFDLAALGDPQVRVWTITAWAFLPMNLFMRGIAFLRVSEMLAEQRRRTYAEAVAEGTMPTA